MVNRVVLLVLFVSATCFGSSASNGANLFDGTKSFENGAVSCVSCHNVNSSLVISGGTLAIDLTSMGGAIEYTLSSLDAMSSLVMKTAYEDKMLTKDEIADIDAFLVQAITEPINIESIGDDLLMYGSMGAVIAFILLGLIGSKRKKESVNQKLFDRQLKSKWRK